jgi:hypothetical protein
LNRKLYVGNLPFSTEERTLEDLFNQAGPVTSVRVMRDRPLVSRAALPSSKWRPRTRARAIERFNTAEVDGRRLAVNEARPMVAGGGGRPFGGGGAAVAETGVAAVDSAVAGASRAGRLITIVLLTHTRRAT